MLLWGSIWLFLNFLHLRHQCFSMLGNPSQHRLINHHNFTYG